MHTSTPPTTASTGWLPVQADGDRGSGTAAVVGSVPFAAVVAGLRPLLLAVPTGGIGCYVMRFLMFEILPAARHAGDAPNDEHNSQNGHGVQRLVVTPGLQPADGLRVGNRIEPMSGKGPGSDGSAGANG